MDDREQSVQHFLDLIKRSHRGKFKIYIGMIAGVGKSYRMLQEAHELLENGVDVQIGYVETHGRVGTEAMLQGLPVISRRKIFYKGKELEEMDLDTIIRIHPEIVIVDELAHTNVEGSSTSRCTCPEIRSIGAVACAPNALLIAIFHSHTLSGIPQAAA